MRITRAICAAVVVAALTTAALATPVFAQWPTTCVDLNDIVEAHLGNDNNVGIYQRVFGDQAEQACQNDHRDDVRGVFAWAFDEAASESQSDIPDLAWPADCVELNDIVENHLGNHNNVEIYQRVFGDQAEPACRNDHREDVRGVFGWAFGLAAPQPERPAVQSSGADRFTAITSGHLHTCALRANGTVVCWGSGEYGQPTPPHDEKFIAVSSGAAHVCALRVDGSAACWGGRPETNGPILGHPQPLGPPPQDEKFTAISSGDSHACALRTDGSAVCWGANWAGQSAVPPGEKFAAITASFDYTCGVRQDNTALCWGNVKDQTVMYLQERFISISGGFDSTCGLTVDGTVACWSKFSADIHHPFPNLRLSHLGSHVSHGSEAYRCGLDLEGSATCWTTLLGGSIELDRIPASHAFIDVSTGLSHGCGILESGSIACWGDNRQNQSAPPTSTAPSPLPEITENCEPGLRVNVGSGCLVEQQYRTTYQFIVADSGRAELYSRDGQLIESQYKRMDISYQVTTSSQDYVTIRASAHANGEWIVETVASWV